MRLPLRSILPSLAFVCLGAFALASSATAQTVKERPPNIVFILMDDLGYSDVSIYGSDYYETPNLDRLAARGVRFTQAYAASTVCSPTRVSVLTGKYPGRLRITHAIPIEGSLRNPTTRYHDANYVKNLPLEEFTIAEALKEAGYATAYIGKWHGSWDDTHFPNYIGAGHPNPAKPCSVVRAGEWKLLESLEDGSVELYNLAEDPAETTDVASRHPDRVAALRALLVDHRIQIDAQYPRPRLR